MNEKALENWILDLFDQYVAEHPDAGSEVEKTRDGVAHRMFDAVESGEVTLPTPEVMDRLRALFDKVVMRGRDKRRAEMTKSTSGICRLLDVLNGDTILGDLDPALDRAYPLGDGRDKTLRYWTAEDWTSSATLRYRKAAEVTEAAKTYDRELADQFTQALASRGVRMTGELFDESTDD